MSCRVNKLTQVSWYATTGEGPLYPVAPVQASARENSKWDVTETYGEHLTLSLSSLTTP